MTDRSSQKEIKKKVIQLVITFFSVLLEKKKKEKECQSLNLSVDPALLL